MIKAEYGNSRLKGTVAEVLTDLTVIVEHIRRVFIEEGMSAEKVDQAINKCIELSKQESGGQKEELSETAKMFAISILLGILGGDKRAD